MSDYSDEYLRGYNDGLEHGKNARIMLCTENEKLRAALKPFAELGMRHAPGSDGDTFIVNIPKASDIRAAAAALKETGDD